MDRLKELESRIIELEIKRQLCQMVIDQNKTDPRIENAIRNQREVNEALVAALKERRALLGIPEPEAQTVNMKPVGLLSRAPGGR